MLNIKIENSKIINEVPTININLYDENNKIIKKNLLIPKGKNSFKIYELGFDPAIGTSPKIPFENYFKSGQNVEMDRYIILGQIMLAILDYCYNKNKLFGIEIAAPNIGQRRLNGESDVDKFIDAMIAYNES